MFVAVLRSIINIYKCPQSPYAAGFITAAPRQASNLITRAALTKSHRYAIKFQRSEAGS